MKTGRILTFTHRVAVGASEVGHVTVDLYRRALPDPFDRGTDSPGNVVLISRHVPEEAFSFDEQPPHILPEEVGLGVVSELRRTFTRPDTQFWIEVGDGSGLFERVDTSDADGTLSMGEGRRTLAQVLTDYGGVAG